MGTYKLTPRWSINFRPLNTLVASGCQLIRPHDNVRPHDNAHDNVGMTRLRTL